MGQPIAKLSAVEVKAASKRRGLKVRKYCDGGGLYLVVNPCSGDRPVPPASWIFRYQRAGKVRDMGIGSYPIVSLEGARGRAAAARALLAEGTDPIEDRSAKAALALRVSEEKPVPTFRECALAHIKAKSPGWTNSKHAAQWENTLKKFAFPEFGDLSVSEVKTAHIVRVLEPIWLSHHVTARRVRERIEAVMNAAKALGYREGENPAAWRGHLENLLPRYSGRVTHHPALPYMDVAAFLRRLGEEVGIAPLALEFVILCACRTNEGLGARWPEIDFDNALWTIPADRMKGRKEHRVPLSDRALAILRKLYELRRGEFVFPGARERRPLSNMALLMLLRRMDRADVTTHGFRSSFRDWAAEMTGFPSEVVEMALAHVVEDRVEGAYRRGQLLEKRRKLMQAWASFCSNPGSGKVIPIRTAS